MKKIVLFLFALLLSVPAYAYYYVTLSQNSITCEDGVGNTYQLKAYLHDGSDVSDVTESEDMQWSSSDSTVATVDRKGLVTIHADGEAIIQMTTDKYTLEFTDYYHNNKCRVASLPVGGTAVPMLREDLVWVSGAKDAQGGPERYCIKVQGDSVVNGVTYKKVFRMLASSNYPDGWYQPGFFVDKTIPAALMREANGRIYRLYKHGGPEDNERILDNFKYFLHLTDSTTEIVQYDFLCPDIYLLNGHQEFQLSKYRRDDVVIDGTKRLVYREDLYDGDEWFEPHLLIEGLGMLYGDLQGSDMLSPCRSGVKGYQPQLGTYYVRSAEGAVLFYDDFYFDYDNEFNAVNNGGDPYDFDRDGGFDIADVNRVINIMTKRQDDDRFKTADLTFDGAVDIEDLNLMINRLVSGVKPVKYSELLTPKAE